MHSFISPDTKSMTHRVSKLKIQTKLHDRLNRIKMIIRHEIDPNTKASYFYLCKNQTDREPTYKVVNIVPCNSEPCNLLKLVSIKH